MAPSGAHANGHPRTSPRVPVADRPHTNTQKGQKSPREKRTVLYKTISRSIGFYGTWAVKGYMCGGWDVACVRGVRMREGGTGTAHAMQGIIASPCARAGARTDDPAGLPLVLSSSSSDVATACRCSPGRT